jgi:hypothetical protein
LVVAPDLLQATPLVTLVAALAGIAVSDPATMTAAKDKRATLRNIKTSVVMRP